MRDTFGRRALITALVVLVPALGGCGGDDGSDSAGGGSFVGLIPAITAVAKSLPIKMVTSSDDAAATEDRDWQTLGCPQGQRDPRRRGPAGQDHRLERRPWARPGRDQPVAREAGHRLPPGEAAGDPV